MTIKPLSNNRVQIEFDSINTDYLLELPGRLEALLQNPDFTKRTVQRILPKGYLDPEKEAEYRELVGEELRRKKLDNIREFQRTITEGNTKWSKLEQREIVQIVLSPEEFEVWLGFLNDMRLLIGTELDITEDRELPEDLESMKQEEFLYEYLTFLQGSLIQAEGYSDPEM